MAIQNMARNKYEEFALNFFEVERCLAFVRLNMHTKLLVAGKKASSKANRHALKNKSKRLIATTATGCFSSVTKQGFHTWVQ